MYLQMSFWLPQFKVSLTESLCSYFVPARKKAGICVKPAVAHRKQEYCFGLTKTHVIWICGRISIQRAGEWNVTLNFISTANTLNSSVGWSPAQGVYRAWITCEIIEISPHPKKRKNRTSFPYLLSVVRDFLNNPKSSWQEVVGTPSSWKLIISFAPAGISGSDGIFFNLSDHTKTSFELPPPSPVSSTDQQSGLSECQ